MSTADDLPPLPEAVECAYSVDGDGPPLLLIHGIGAARDTWRFMLDGLAARFTVITYDLRGHGVSPAGSEHPFTLDHLVSDVERVRERSGFERVHIAGHSLGGMIGPAYARHFPTRVRSLGLLSTAAARTPQDTANVMAVVEKMEAEGVANVLPTLVDRWYTDAFIASHRDIVDRRLAQVCATDKAIFLNVFRIYAQTEMINWLGDIAAPSLVLTGQSDGGCPPRLNKQITAALPDAELVVLPDVKHSILLECGPAVARHMLAFLGRFDGAS
ncbi:MAG: alpha/beta hydrolase [Pseudomonadota bacterium]